MKRKKKGPATDFVGGRDSMTTLRFRMRQNHADFSIQRPDNAAILNIRSRQELVFGEVLFF